MEVKRQQARKLKAEAALAEQRLKAFNDADTKDIILTLFVVIAVRKTNKMEINVDVDQLISPHFDKVLFADALNKVLKGGRSSTKSSVISLQIVQDFLADPQSNALIMRKVGNTIELSVYEQIKWAIYQLHVEHLFTFRKSPYRIIDKRNGTAFYFSGVDDPAKLKPMVIAKGYVSQLWFEELAEFDSWEEVDMVRASFTRKKLPPGKHVVTYYSYNPPKNPYAWINEWVAERQTMPKWYVDSSDYCDVAAGILLADYLEEIATVKNNDLNYYKWYLGQIIGLGNNIYNMNLFHKLDAIPADDYLTNIYFSQDSGQQVSATTESCFGITAQNKVILLDTYYYSPVGKVVKKAPSDLDNDLYNIETKWINECQMQPWKKSADSATSDFALEHEMYKRHGLSYHHVTKSEKTKVIDHVQDLLASGRFYYLDKPSNAIFIKEHRQYRWNEKTVNTAKPTVIKENDHTCDSFQYFVLDNLQDLGLKW